MPSLEIETDYREGRLLCSYLVITLTLTILWWIGVFTVDSVAKFTLGQAFQARGIWLLLLGDFFSGVVLPILGLVLLKQKSPLLAHLLWVHFGAQAYAFAVSLVGSIIDPMACYGAYLMMASAGAALCFAMRQSRVPILWGPFRFSDSGCTDSRRNTQLTLRQTVLMWTVFFALIPGLMKTIEVILGWKLLPSVPLWASLSCSILFLIFGAVGIGAGIEMARKGEGTPLPSTATQRLVVSGSYRFVRNPMAFASIVQGTALGIVLNSGLVVIYSLIGGIAWELLVRPLEEEHLSNKFGTEYEAYREHVRCWIPNLHRLRSR